VKKTVWLAILFGVLVVGYVMYSSFSPKAYRVRVCMSYKGGTNCGTASADKREVALREATTNACALIASVRGRLVVPKTTLDGVAVAIVADEWGFGS